MLRNKNLVDLKDQEKKFDIIMGKHELEKIEEIKKLEWELFKL